MNYMLIALVLSLVLFIFSVFKKFGKRWRKFALLFLSFCLIVLTGFGYLFPFNPTPEPKGDKEVLTADAFYRHETAFPKMQTGKGEREIPVRVWYPRGAKEKSQPLLVFSHGSFGVSLSNETLFRELASRGYVVVSLDHPHHSFSTTLSDGQAVRVDGGFLKDVMGLQKSTDIQANLAALRGWLEIRVEDMNFVLDTILDGQGNNDFEKYVDPGRIVLSGHSLGGSAALAVGDNRHEQVRAVVALESPFIHDIEGVAGESYVFSDGEYPIPVAHIYSDAVYPHIAADTLYKQNYSLIKADDARFLNTHITGVGHLGLTDLALVSPALTNWLDSGLDTRRPPETLVELNGYVVDFLATYNG